MPSSKQNQKCVSAGFPDSMSRRWCRAHDVGERRHCQGRGHEPAKRNSDRAFHGVISEGVNQVPTS